LPARPPEEKRAQDNHDQQPVWLRLMGLAA
jgi:hypothetical protein